MESKIWYKGTYLQNRNRLTDMKNRLVVAKEKRGVGWTGRLQSVDANSYLEWISNEVLLNNTGKYIQSLGIEHDGR